MAYYLVYTLYKHILNNIYSPSDSNLRAKGRSHLVQGFLNNILCNRVIVRIIP